MLEIEIYQQNLFIDELSHIEGVLGQTPFTICPQKHVNCSFIQFQLDKSVSSRISIILWVFCEPFFLWAQLPQEIGTGLLWQVRWKVYRIFVQHYSRLLPQGYSNFPFLSCLLEIIKILWLFNNESSEIFFAERNFWEIYFSYGPFCSVLGTNDKLTTAKDHCRLGHSGCSETYMQNYTHFVALKATSLWPGEYDHSSRFQSHSDKEASAASKAHPLHLHHKVNF